MCIPKPINPQSTEIFNLNFYSLKVLFRYRDTQLQVTEKIVWFEKFKFHCISVFQDWKHVLLFKIGYTGAYKMTECLLYSTSVC